jgi:predicted acyltransferase
MVIVNMAIDDDRSYGQLLHSVWNGYTLTDAVFPAFLFAMGASMALSFGRTAAATDREFYRRVLRRSVGLFLIGVLLGWFPFVKYSPAAGLHAIDLAHVRIFGVLQRFALTYAAAAFVIRRFGTRGALVTAVAALLAYAVLLPMSGDMSLVGNGPRALDLWLIGANHLYLGEGIPFDPEGLMSTVPALANVLAGYLAAKTLGQGIPSSRSIRMLVAAGAVALLLALIWSQSLPFNKKLWTSSYALLNIGIDVLVLGVLSQMIDRCGWRRGLSVFSVLGGNTLAVYLFSELGNEALSRTWIGDVNTFEWAYSHLFAPWAGPKFGSLLYCLAFLALCVAFAFELARRHVRFRL